MNANCGKEHHVSNCSLFAKKYIDDRLNIAKDKGLCFNCLLPMSPSHVDVLDVRLRDATKDTIVYFTASSFCKDLQNPKADKESESDEITSQAGIASGYLSTSIENQVMLLPTAVVELVTPDATLPVRVLVDSGSDQSYIWGEIVEALGLDTSGFVKTMTILMHGGQSQTTRGKKTTFQLSARNRKANITLHAWSVPTVCSPPEPAIVDLKQYLHLKGLALANTNPRSGAAIDILIGADQWSQIIKGGIRSGDSCSPMAMNSVFDWLLSGPTGVERYKPCASTHHATTKILEDDPNLILKKLWELETIGVPEEPKGLNTEEGYVVQQLKDNVKFDGQRCEVSLPWRKNCSELTSNRGLALK